MKVGTVNYNYKVWVLEILLAKRRNYLRFLQKMLIISITGRIYTDHNLFWKLYKELAMVYTLTHVLQTQIIMPWALEITRSILIKNFTKVCNNWQDMVVSSGNHVRINILRGKTHY